MPRIFAVDGYRFFFYSNEHKPVHVHARYGSGEAVFDLEPVVTVRDAAGLKPNELARAKELAIQHRNFIIHAWHEFFDELG